MSLYKQPKSPFWWTHFTIPGHPRVRQSTGCADRAAAQKYEDKLKAALHDQKPATATHLWSEAVGLWLEARTRGEPELYRLQKLETIMGNPPLDECTAERIEKALSFCKTAGTFTRYRNMILAILNLAQKKKLMVEAPKIDARVDRKLKPREWITPAQWLRLRDELPPHQKLMAEFSIETGLRQANALSLRWEKLDMKRKIAWFDGYETKSGQPLSVPLSDNALRVLEEAARVIPVSERVASKMTGRPAGEGYVFLYKGQPIKEVKTAWQAACVRAGLATYVDGKYKGFVWHGMRHTWATWHVQNGTPLEVLKDLGGWADLKMVLRYAHHSVSHVAKFANANKIGA